MNGLREMLADVADEARTYEVTDRAVRAARRRARVHRYAPVAALAAVVLLVVGVWIPLGPSGGGPSLVAGPVPWLPEVVVPPAQAPPPLGADRPVGPGSLLYRVRDQPGTILVTSDGRQYTVPDGDDRTALSLSPDGRWLLLDVDGRLVVQDLRDGGRRQVSATDPSRLSWRWSPNGRWLMVGATAAELAAPAGEPVVRLVDLSTWRTAWSRSQPAGMSLLAVLDSGEILVRYAGADSLALLHPSGAERSLHLRLDGVLSPRERLSPAPVESQVLADGGSLLLRAWVELPADQLSATVPDDLLVLDISNGAALRRVALPDPVFRGPAGGPLSADPSKDTEPLGTASEPPSGTDAGYDIRVSAAVAPEGVLLRHHLLSGAVELELLDPGTGQLTLATRTDSRIDDLRPRGYPG
jgi:hypothetical protein